MKINTFRHLKFRNAECILLSKHVVQIPQTYYSDLANVLNLQVWIQINGGGIGYCPLWTTRYHDQEKISEYSKDSNSSEKTSK